MELESALNCRDEATKKRDSHATAARAAADAVSMLRAQTAAARSAAEAALRDTSVLRQEEEVRAAPLPQRWAPASRAR